MGYGATAFSKQMDKDFSILSKQLDDGKELIASLEQRLERRQQQLQIEFQERAKYQRELSLETCKPEMKIKYQQAIEISTQTIAMLCGIINELFPTILNLKSIINSARNQSEVLSEDVRSRVSCAEVEGKTPLTHSPHCI